MRHCSLRRPDLVVLVMLDEPNAPVIYGGTLAAPVAGKILADALPYLGVEAIYTEEEQKQVALTVPSVIGKSVTEATSKLESSGLTVKTVGNGDKVIRQLPAAGQSISRNGTVVIYTDGAEDTKVKVPNFTGCTISAANQLANQYHLNISLSGVTGENSGSTAYSQSVKAGDEVDMGTVITVSFRVASTD